MINKINMEDNLEYDPLQWPPSVTNSTQHFNCCKPGIDNPEGYRCRCCQRLEKLDNSKWPARDITKDFKNYGGGVPGYFYLLLLFIVVMLILTVVKVIFHIYVLQIACPMLVGTKTPCTHAGVLQFCDSALLYRTLQSNNHPTQALALQILQIATYIILVVATIFIKIFLQLINKDKISLDEKLFSRFSLLIKNVPPYYQLEDLKEELKILLPKLQVCEMFYLHKTGDYDEMFKRQFELYFQIKKHEETVSIDNKEKNLAELQKREKEYIQLHDKIYDLRDNLTRNTKKVVMVFNTIEDKETIHQHLRMNECSKFAHYMRKTLDMKSNPIGYYSERLPEPQEINWKYIGESSTHKQKVRIETTVIGFGFMVVSFALFYFPMIKIDEENIYDPSIGTGLGLLIAIIIIILTNVYILIIDKLITRRKPSTKLAESYFMVTTTVVFHFFFYLLTPALFYGFINSIPNNIKLDFFFTTTLLFCILNSIFAGVDSVYRSFKTKKEKLMGQASLANNYCQQRLHEELTPPSFPVEFKLMFAFNIWTFNSFYVFQLPYLLFIFMLTLILVYWVDKRNLYKHYKIQHYLSIQLQLKVQKTYIVLFLICVSYGYYLCTVHAWENYIIIVVVVAALVVNFTLNYSYQKQKDSILKQNTDIKSAIEKCKSMEASALHLNLIEQEMKRSFIVPANHYELKFSSVSLGTSILDYGYREAYHMYLQQFKNKEVNHMLEQKYFSLKSINNGEKKKRKESEMANLMNDGQGLHEHLIAQDKQGTLEERESNKQIKIEHYCAPTDINASAQPYKQSDGCSVEDLNARECNLDINGQTREQDNIDNPTQKKY